MASLVLEDDNKGIESISMKLILKQVYAVHTTKIKSLAAQLKETKEKLLLLETSKRKEKSECSQCKELQILLGSVRQEYSAAFQEQTKKFENLIDLFPQEQESSFLGNEESCIFGDNLSKETMKENSVDVQARRTQVVLSCVNETENASLKETLKENIGIGNSPNNVNSTEHSNTSKNGLPTIIVVPDATAKNDIPSISSPGKTHTNLAVSDRKDFFSSLHNSFFENSMDNSNIVLVPETCDIDQEVNPNYNSCWHSSNMPSASSQKENAEFLDYNAFQEDIYCEEEKENCKVNGLFLETNKFSGKCSNANMNTSGEKIIKKCKKKNSVNEIIPPIVHVSTSCGAQSSTKLENFSDFPINSTFFRDDSDLMLSKSPSLLTNNESKTAVPKVNTIPSIDDNDDFQIEMGNTKVVSETESWKSCKKSSKKGTNFRPIKSTSRFKITLQAPGLNFKKPKYKQTKLSEGIFASKSESATDKVIEAQNVCNDDSVDEKISNTYGKKQLRFGCGDEDKSSETSIASLEGTLLTHNMSIDFDRTFIPENYQCSPLKSSLQEIPTDSNSQLSSSKRNINNVNHSDQSNKVVCENKAQKKRILSRRKLRKEENGKTDVQKPSEEYCSFDRIPEVALPNYKFKEESVRNQNKRRQLQGYECRECEKYYSELGLSDEEKRKRLKHCSRHRATYVPPSTPEHFWELEFPNTQECKARGYLEETQKVALKPRRKRPL